MHDRLAGPHPGRETAFAALLTMLKSRSKPRTMLILLGLLLAFAPAFVALNIQLGGTTPPESMFGYSAQRAYQAFEAEGEGGRQFHLLFEAIDLFLIPVYALLYSMVIAYTGQRLFGQHSRVVNWSIVIPLLAGLVDYAEDAVLVTLLVAYPQPLTALATLAGFLTITKWILVGTGVSLAVLGLFGLIGQSMLRWKRRRHQRWDEDQRLDLPRPTLAA